MKTFNDFKKQVAEKHGYSDWPTLNLDMRLHGEAWELDERINEAAELYAQAKANEAVKEDRGSFMEMIHEHDLLNADVISDLIDRPLPYPEQQ